MLGRFISVAAVGLLLAGCVTTANTLAPEQISSFRLQSVDVTIVPNAGISWSDAERDLAVSKGLDTPERWAAAQDGLQEQIRRTIAAKMRDSMMREVGSQLGGTRPVRINVRIHEFRVTAGAVRVLFGGNHAILADIDIVDGRNGALLLAFPAHQTFIQGGNGLIGVALDNLLLDEPADRIIRLSALEYRNWLLRK
jgi:hypothetical protein